MLVRIFAISFDLKYFAFKIDLDGLTKFDLTFEEREKCLSCERRKQSLIVKLFLELFLLLYLQLNSLYLRQVKFTEGSVEINPFKVMTA